MTTSNETSRRGYPWWAWLLGVLFLIPLPAMIVGYFVPAARKYLGWVIAGSFAVFLGIMGLTQGFVPDGAGESTARQSPLPNRAPAQSTGIGVSRNAVQSALEKQGFAFDAPWQREGETIVNGRLYYDDWIVSITLTGPSHDLQRALISAEGPDRWGHLNRFADAVGIKDAGVREWIGTMILAEMTQRLAFIKGNRSRCIGRSLHTPHRS